MTSPIRKVLIVGGGIGGMSAALAFRKFGVGVDMVDLDPDWKVYGAGLTITGPTLRAFARLGVLDEVGARGYLSRKVEFFTADGAFMREMETPVLEPGIPTAGGILRPVLHDILSSRTRQAGVNVRLGVTVETIEHDGPSASAAFTDGDVRVYDAVVGADGFMSTMRQMLFPLAPKPAFTGQGCWRVLAPRPDEVQNAQIYFAPNGLKVGINPCSPDSMYLFATVPMPGNPFVPTDQWLDRMREILRPFGGRIAEVREGLGPDSNVNYRPLEAVLVPPPWHLGVAGLLGDAVHATTPHLASGAGLSVEDGLVVAECLMKASDAEGGWRAFEERRWPRCSLVVQNSLEIGRLEMEGEHDDQIARLMGQSVAALAQPI